MKTVINICVSSFIVSILSLTVSAQTKVTFNLNMKQALQDSIFIPPANKIKLVGDIQPLNGFRTIYLYDTEPIDSVYSVEIDFPWRYEGQTLTYNFVIELQNKTLEEQGTRAIKLNGKEIELPPIQFGAFAW